MIAPTSGVAVTHDRSRINTNDSEHFSEKFIDSISTRLVEAVTERLLGYLGLLTQHESSMGYNHSAMLHAGNGMMMLVPSAAGFSQMRGGANVARDLVRFIRLLGDETTETKKAPARNSGTLLDRINSADNAVAEAKKDQAVTEAGIKSEMEAVAERMGAEVKFSGKSDTRSKSSTTEIETKIQNRIKQLESEALETRTKVAREQSKINIPGSKWKKANAVIAEREANIVKSTVEALYKKAKQERKLAGFDITRAENIGKHLASLERIKSENKYREESFMPTNLIGKENFQYAADVAKTRQEALLREVGLSESIDQLRYGSY